MQSVVLSSCRPQGCSFCRVLPEIDIWRAANLMLKRYGDKALEKSERAQMSWQPPTITTA